MKKINVSNYKVIVGQKNQLPHPVRIVLLSDLHNQTYGLENERLVRMIRQEKPDLIIVAGDMLTSDQREREHIALALMRRLVKEYPVYYANGNHEYRMKIDTDTFGRRYQVYAEALRAAGVHLLENESADVTVRGLQIRIFGLEIPWEFYHRISRTKLSQRDITKVLGETAKDRYNLLIAHNPACFAAYMDWGAQLAFSGHIHGGFVRLPFLGGVISPQFRLFPKYDKGIFERDGRYMVISAGIGTHSVLPRLGNPVEIVTIDLCQGLQNDEKLSTIKTLPKAGKVRK